MVLLTHFMDEAESLCDRVAILRGGRLRALDSPGRLVAALPGNTRIRFAAAPEQATWFEGLSGVEHVRWRGGLLEVTGAPQAVAHVGRVLTERDAVPDDLRIAQASLEDAYLALTGGEP